MCLIHPSMELEFVCIDKTCKNSSAFCCFTCIRNEHKQCSDEAIIEHSEFMDLTIEINNTQELNSNILNKAQSNMSKALSHVQSALLKKKDLLIDFCYLNDQDFIENLPQIYKIYSEFLFCEYNSKSKEVVMSSHFKFLSPSEIKKRILASFEKDVNDYLSKHFNLNDKSLLTQGPLLKNEFNFDPSKLEVISKQAQQTVYEIYYKGSVQDKPAPVKKSNSWTPDNSMMSSELSDFSGSEESICEQVTSSKLIVFESKTPLKGVNNLK